MASPPYQGQFHVALTAEPTYHGISLTKHLGASWCSSHVQVATLRSCFFAHGSARAADSGDLRARHVPAVLASCRWAGDLDILGTVDMTEGRTGKHHLCPASSISN
ncbi:hypothetical protein MRX96_021037 [Rhipicephalus microplus]